MNKLVNILYFIISLLDKIDYNINKHKKLLDNIKITDDYKLFGISIYTDTGFKEATDLMLTKPFDIYKIELENGYYITCADTHILFDNNMNEVFVKDININDYIQTDNGVKKIIKINHNNIKVSMCDLSVNDDNHRFYSNGILSHNSTTTAIAILHKALFSCDINGLILSKSGPAGVDLLKKVKDMVSFLPFYLKPGIVKWNQHEITFDNNSILSTQAFSPTAAIGMSINYLVIDECAFLPVNMVEEFYMNAIPTITADTNSHIAIMSTQNGRGNKFYQLWTDAEQGKSNYKTFNVDWWQVPMWDGATKTWKKRTEEWKKEMVGILGSEEAFQYQYGTAFCSSDFCIASRETCAKLRKTAVNFINRDDLLFESMHKEFLFFHPDFNIETLKTHKFLILADLAEGGGGDYTVFNIFEITEKDHFKQVGYWRCNILDLEKAALEFWLIVTQLFDQENLLISIEWNTYGALFYSYLMNLNDDEYYTEYLWRFQFGTGEIDTNCVIRYKKGDNTEELAGLNVNMKFDKLIPGIRFNSGNKITACSLLKMSLEKEEIELYSLAQVSELENFEDKSGNGSYKASYGHDDMMMTLCQIPMLKQTARYKDFIISFEEETTVNKLPKEFGGNMYSVLNGTNYKW